MAACNPAVTRPYRLPQKLNIMGKGCFRRYAVFFFLQEKMQNCYRQQVKRRVPTHWIEQCQKKYMIHWFGQCQSRSAEYTGFETLSEGVHSHCLVEPSPVSSASVPPQLAPGTAATAVVSAFSVVYTMSETLSEEAISPLPPFPVSAPPAPILFRSRPR